MRNQLFVVLATSLFVANGAQAFSLPDGEKQCPAGHVKIFVAADGRDKNSGLAKQAPLLSLKKAQAVAERINQTNPPGFCLLLRAGDVFEIKYSTALKARSATVPKTEAEADSPDRNRAAFQWKLDKPLLLSSYGTGGATLRAGMGYFARPNFRGEIQQTIKTQIAVAITRPSRAPVVISNLIFDRWELNGIYIYGADNVTVRNNIFRHVGSLYFKSERMTVPGEDDGGELPMFAGGVVKAKYAENILIEGNLMEDAHNRELELKDDLHAIYVQKSSNVKIVGNTIRNMSGVPIKFDDGSHDGLVSKNTLKHVGLTTIYRDRLSQIGFVRITCTSHNACPYNVLVEDNIFDGAYCIPQKGRSNCQGEVGAKYSGNYFELNERKPIPAVFFVQPPELRTLAKPPLPEIFYLQNLSYKQVCENTCWRDATSNKSKFSCSDLCRGVVFNRNTYNLSP